MSAHTLVNAECPTCKAPLPVVVGKESIVRATICYRCGDEFQYSAWVLFIRSNQTFTKIELAKTASGHHVRPLTEADNA